MTGRTFWKKTILALLIAVVVSLPLGWIVAMLLTPVLWRLEPVFHLELAGHSGPSDWVFLVIWDLTFLKYPDSKLQIADMGTSRTIRSALPLQVAAVCYRRRNSHAEFLLVNTNGGGKWTFPKGAPEARLSHSQAAEREAQEEAGAIGIIEPRHFHIYVHSKGVFWQSGGVQEYVVKAFLMEVQQTRRPDEAFRNPIANSRLLLTALWSTSELRASLSPAERRLQNALRRPPNKLMTRTTNPTTSSKWIRLPPRCKLKPRSHKIRRTIKMVQSMSISCTRLRAPEL